MYKVSYHIKNTNKSSNDHNVLLNKKNVFDELQDAIRFVKLLKFTHGGVYQLVGEPVIERKEKNARSYH
jgi:hypothetical protein